MPPRKKSVQKRAQITKKTLQKRYNKIDRDSENYISSVGDTNRILSFLSCLKCLMKGLSANFETKKLFQKRIENNEIERNGSNN